MTGRTAFLIAAPFLIVLFLACAGLSQSSPQDAPGLLSRAHSRNPGLEGCFKCHDEDMNVQAARCLACHTEIAARQKAGMGFHRDKKEDCAACHQEHRGEDIDLKPLDPGAFDHSETGTVLEGPHAAVGACDKCHRPANTLPRQTGRSYLFTTSGCGACHVSPHPGRQDVCVSCHEPTSWRVTPWKVMKRRSI